MPHYPARKRIIARDDDASRKPMTINRIEDTQLYSLLNNKYRRPVGDLCQEACDLARRTPLFFPEYTLHDSVHFLRVAELEALIIGLSKLKQLEQDEIVLLILAAFYHDIGMSFNENDLDLLRNSEDFALFREEWRFSHPNMSELEQKHKQTFLSEAEKIRIGGSIAEMERALLSDYLRTKHPGTSKEYVLQHFCKHPQLGCFAQDLGEICLSHGMSVDWIRNHPSLSPSRKYLCYVLRLADILDFDGDRAPNVLFRSISFSSQVSLQEWEKHIGVKNWHIGEDAITFTMEYHHPAYEKAARDFIGWINQELEQVHLALADLSGYEIIKPSKVIARITSCGYEYHDLSFSLSRDQIVHLFMTDELYGDKSLFVRELLQNSLDALRLRKAIKALSGETWTEGAVELRHYMDDKGRSVIECTDNGCGMDLDIIERYFGRVGRSYYRSNEFEKLNARLKMAGVGFDPCSRFGIGFMSVFMVADEIEVYTRKEGKEPYVLEIRGLSDLFVIKKGTDEQPIGTTVRAYERNQPPAYDSLSDAIRLVETVGAYAIACEFPIHTKCTVPGIVGSLDIDAGILEHKTFLEELGIPSTKDYTFNFHETDKRLNGSMRMTFLIDQEGHITLNNGTAEWLRLKEEAYAGAGIDRFRTYLQYQGEKVPYYSLPIGDNPNTISCDGIAIAGVSDRKDRSSLRKEIMSDTFLGISGGVYTLDIRGDLKPDLTPARTPVEMLPNSPSNWMRIKRVLARAVSSLWENILTECTLSDMPAIWSYLCIYEFPFRIPFTTEMISKKVLEEKMALPIKGGKWLPLHEIDAFIHGDDSITLITKDGARLPVFFGPDILHWLDDTSSYNLMEFAKVILYRTAKLSISDSGKGRLLLDHAPSESPIMYHLKSEVLEFIGVDSSFILSLTPHLIYNENAPIVKIAAKVWGVKDKNPFEQFADTFCEYLFDYFIYELEDSKDAFKDNGRHFHYCGALYKALNKKEISAEYLPPYRILGPAGQQFEITEVMLLKWAEITDKNDSPTGGL